METNALLERVKKDYMQAIEGHKKALGTYRAAKN